jgi:glutamate dehydrogenase/leucine dehydrogenase
MNENPFESAMKQLNKAAEYLSQDELEYLPILLLPQREVEARIPFRMDDGTLNVVHAYRVQYDNTRGPYKGGIRFHQDTEINEVRALSFWMAIKTATVNIPLGGGKGGATINPKLLSETELERLSRGWVRAMASVIGPDIDIPAPDVNTTPQIMEWMADEYGKVTGKYQPGVITGKPVTAGGSEGRGTATAQGAFYTLEKMLEGLGKEKEGTSVIVQGFGNAGSYFALLCHEAGMKIIGVSDSRGAIFNPEGFDPNKVLEHKKATKSVQGFVGATDMTNDELLVQQCDILAPAALENAITAANANDIKAIGIVELANGPTTPAADEILVKKNIIVVPDVLANAGGVTVSYFEWLQNLSGEKWTEEEVFTKLEPIMKDAFDSIWKKKEEIGEDMRTAAFILAVQRIILAMKDKHENDDLYKDIK